MARAPDDSAFAATLQKFAIDIRERIYAVKVAPTVLTDVHTSVQGPASSPERVPGPPQWRAPDCIADH